MKKHYNKLSRGITQVVVLLITAFVGVPIYFMYVNTFKNQNDVLLHPMSLPFHPTITNLVDVFRSMNYTNAIKNNIIITSISVILIIFLSSIAAYPIARHKNKLNSTIFLILLGGMIVPLQMLIIPLYKIVVSLGLMNSLYGVIIIIVTINIPFAVFLFTGFIRALPYSVEEAAFIDGCSLFGAFVRIVLPMLKPVIATVAIIDALSTWNEFLIPVLFLQSRENSVLVLEVYKNVGQFGIDYYRMSASIALAVAPLLIFYIFMQRFIIKGVVAGSING